MADDSTQDTGDASSSGVSGEVQRKHRLQHPWCLWVLLPNPSVKDNWHSSQQNVHSFTTVEDFWRLFNNIKTPSRLGTTDLSVFKKDVAPAWEDEVCRQGGRWVAKIDRMRPQDFDSLWLNLVLSLIGEAFGDAGSCICGAVVSARNKNSKMALWISARDEEKAMLVGHAYHKVLKDAGFTGEIAFEDFTSQSKAAFSLPGGKGDPQQASS